MTIDPQREFERDRSPLLESARAAIRAAEQLFSASRRQSGNDDAPNPTGQQGRLYSDHKLSSSGNTVTVSPCDGNDIRMYSVDGWVPKPFLAAVTLDTTGYTTDKKYDLFFTYDDASETWIPSATAWTNETTQAVTLDTVDGIQLLSTDYSYRYLGWGRYNGSTMLVSGSNALGMTYYGTGDPEDPTGADPFSGVIMDADGIRGYNAGVLQFQDFSSNGTRTAAAGAVVLDKAGMAIQLGDALFLAGYGLIGTSEVGATPTPVLNLEVYDQSSANTLTNGDFETGNLTGWTTVAGSPTVISSDFYDGAYCVELDSSEEISQTVGSFSGKHPVIYFWHKGPKITLDIEGLDAGSANIFTFERVFSQSDTWVRCSAGFYNDYATVTQIKVRLTGNGTDALADSVNLLKLDDYARVSIGDAYSTNKDVVRVAARKLMVGNGSASANSAMLDVRGNIQAYNVNNSGWMGVTDTWAYASASTITIPSDGTLTYQKGDYLRWKQGGGYKYGTVATLTATVITIIVNTDYTVANSAITDVAYSRAANPQGWPGFFNWAANPTGYSAQPTNVVYRYSTRGSQLFGNIREVTPGTSNGTGVTFTLPVAAVTIANHAWQGATFVVRDNMADLTAPGAWSIVSAGTTLTAYKNYALGAWTNSGTKCVYNAQFWYEF